MDFFEKGYAIVELFDPKFASDLWNDVDKEEIYRLLDNVSDKPWKSLTFPRTESFGQFVMETDRNMNKCWERYGKQWLKPKIVAQHLSLFMRTQKNLEKQDVENHIWVLVPLFTVSEHEGLPILMEGSHLNPERQNHRPYHPVVQPGHALMFDARIQMYDPNAGGGVVFARAYDMASK